MHVVVVGAGVAGLTAASHLSRDPGISVTVLDKGRSVGGRLATRRIGAAVVDHGAQFFTVRSAEFQQAVSRWIERGVVSEWCRGFDDPPDGYPRYAAIGGMNALAKHMAAEAQRSGRVTVRCTSMAFAVRPLHRPGAADRWSVGLDDGTAVEGDAVVLTSPVPQSYSLLVTSGTALPDELMRMEYDRTIALLVVLDRPASVPEPGAAQDCPPFSMITDNYRKGATETREPDPPPNRPASSAGRIDGVSPVPAITFHANPEWSESHWGDTHESLRDTLIAAGAPWIGDAAVIAAHIKKWRFATPRTPWPDRCWWAGPHDSSSGAIAPIALAGDAFGGPRVEGAYLSGRAAADAIYGALRSAVRGAP